MEEEVGQKTYPVVNEDDREKYDTVEQKGAEENTYDLKEEYDVVVKYNVVLHNQVKWSRKEVDQETFYYFFLLGLKV